MEGYHAINKDTFDDMCRNVGHTCILNFEVHTIQVYKMGIKLYLTLQSCT